MEILELVNNNLVISPVAIDLTFFNTLWVRDKSKDKSKAIQDIKYIFYSVNFKSPFFKFPPNQREGLIKSDIIGMKNYKPDEEVNRSLEAYKQYYIKTYPTISLFESVLLALDNMQKFFKGLDYEEFTATDIVRIQDSVIRMPKLQEAVQAAYDNCKKEQSTSIRARGDYKAKLFED